MADQEARHSTDRVRVLDPCCGNGRHSLELSGRRFDVAGSGDIWTPNTLSSGCERLGSKVTNG